MSTSRRPASSTTGPSKPLDFTALMRESEQLNASLSALRGKQLLTGFAAPTAGPATTLTPATEALAAAAVSVGVGIGGANVGIVPPIQRNIVQLDAAAKSMFRAHPTQNQDADVDTQASLFMASHGVDVRKQKHALRKLDEAAAAAVAASRTQAAAPTVAFAPTRTATKSSNATAASMEDAQLLAELDVEKFLHKQHERVLNSAVEEAVFMTNSSFLRGYLSSLDSDWEEEKKEILENLGFRHGKLSLLPTNIAQTSVPTPSPNYPTSSPSLYSNSSSTPSANVASSPLPASSPSRSSSSHIHSTETASLSIDTALFARVISQLNTARHQRHSFALFDHLTSVLTQLEPHVSQLPYQLHDVRDCLDVIKFMLQQQSNDNPQENAYKDEYLSDSSRLKSQLVSGAKKYSEHLFSIYLSHVVAMQSTRSGVPGLESDITAYVNMSLPRDSNRTDETSRTFASIYFALRCGSIQTAYKFANQFIHNSGSNRGNALLEAVVRLATHGRLTSEIYVKLSEEYNREVYQPLQSSSRVSVNSDPFQVVLYHILGRLKIHPAMLDVIYKTVIGTTEDYLWFKLHGIHATLLDGDDKLPALTNLEDAHHFSLNYVQESILERGEGHFNSDNSDQRIFVYFKVLLLTSQFEQAIYYLLKFPQLLNIAVIFASTLNYYGLLRTTENQLFERLPSRKYCINYTRVICKYVERFIRSCTVEAFHFLYLLYPTLSSSSSSSTSLSLIPSASSSSSYTNTQLPYFGVFLDFLAINGDYNVLLGRIENNMILADGLFFTYFPSDVARGLINATASKLQSQAEDVLRIAHLYILAQDYTAVTEILLKSLSKVVHLNNSNVDKRNIVDFTKAFTNLLNHQKSTGRVNGLDLSSTDSLLNSLSQILVISDFFALYHSNVNAWDNALSVIEQLSFLPLRYTNNMNSNDTRNTVLSSHALCNVEECLSTFSLCAIDIKLLIITHVIPTIMDIFYHQYNTIKKEAGQFKALPTYSHRDAEKQHYLRNLRTHAHALVKFVSLSPLSASAEIKTKLVKLEALMS